MQLSGFIDVGLALVTAYLLLSLLGSTINEIINTLLKTRAEMLATTIKSILDSDDLRTRFFNHGLIGGIGRSSTGGAGGTTPAAPQPPAKEARPSYLDSRTFADALLGVLAGDKVPVVADIQSVVEKLEPGATKDALRSALALASEDITKLRDAVAGWFDSSMDRLSGNFVRYMKWLSFGVGVGLALLLNVDSIDLATRAWNEDQFRKTIEETAGKLQQPLVSCTSDQLTEKLECETDNMNGLFEALRPLPVGWGAGAVPWNKFYPEPRGGEPGAPPTTGQPGALAWQEVGIWLFFKIIGLALTGLAVSLGAPFWFDVLQRVMNLRGAGTKPTDTATSGTAS